LTATALQVAVQPVIRYIMLSAHHEWRGSNVHRLVCVDMIFYDSLLSQIERKGGYNDFIGKNKIGVAKKCKW